MLGNVPNFAFCVGYTNASWTLRADLSSLFVCRLLNQMTQRGYRTCMPLCDPSTLDPKPLLDLSSGYIQRAAAELPKQASQKPWFIRQNYVLDALTMKLGRIEDGTLQFTKSSAASAIEQHLRPQDCGNCMRPPRTNADWFGLIRPPFYHPDERYSLHLWGL